MMIVKVLILLLQFYLFMRHRNNHRPLEAQSFWEQLEIDIDQMGNRARDKLMKYEQKQFQTIKPNPQSNKRINVIKPMVKEKEQKKCMAGNHSLQRVDRKQLVKLQKIESEKKNLMANRLAYFRQDKQKQHKTIELAKKKFSELITIRTQSFKQKQSIRHKMASIDKEEKTSKSLIVKQVKSARDQRNLSLMNWKQSVTQTAKQIRRQTLNNESFVRQLKEKIAHENQQRAASTKQSLEKSRSIASEANGMKILRVKKRSREQLSSRLKALSQKQKSNQSLFFKLQSEANKIGKWKQKAQKQIQQYRSILGIKERRSQMLGSSTKKTQQSTKSFYITNY